MSDFKGVFQVLILFILLSCEHAEKQSGPSTIKTKISIQPIPKGSIHQKMEKKLRRIIPPEIPVVRIDPVPEPYPYYLVEPPVVCPTVDPVVIKGDTIYDFPAILPEFPSGQQALLNYLQTNMVYPEDAKEMGIEGKVFVSFGIFEDGSIQQASVLRGINGNKSCEKEVLRLIYRMPKWLPGKNELGQTIKARVKIPVVFRLD